VLHDSSRQRHVDGLPAELAVPTWTWPDGLPEIQAIAPECLLSVLFGHLVPRPWLDVPSWLPINVHPGLLPYNAGANPNVWPLVDGSPAGTTIHVMSESIDAGPILMQRQVTVSPADTAASLYERLEEASFELLRDSWASIRTVELTPQPTGGTHHRQAELRSLDPSPDDWPLIDRLRARTFPPYGAEFERDGRRWRIRVQVEPLD
jgi:methionyl-tRNA formyltransferase